MATPELDVIHQGDDRTGEVSASGYDETVVLDLSKAPADVERYAILVSYYEDPDTGSGQTLGMATNIVCGFKDEVSGHELQAKVEEQHGFDVTAHVVTISKTADGKWEMEHVDEGFSEKADAVVVNKFGFVAS
jgi:stress response protein SCP2